MAQHQTRIQARRAQPRAWTRWECESLWANRRRQQQTFRAREPQLTRPAQLSLWLPAANGQYVANRLRRFAIRVISGQQVFGAHLKTARERFHESESFGRAKTVLLIFVRDEADILPDGNAVGTPDSSSTPNAARLAGIPFALTVVKQVAPEAILSRRPLDQRQAASSLHRAQRHRCSIAGSRDRRCRRRLARRPWSGAHPVPSVPRRRCVQRL